MKYESLQSSSQPGGRGTLGGSGRLFYLDNLRTAMVVLVVLHHLAGVYGAFIPFYYVEPPFNKGMMMFSLFNQSFFMGVLFLLAGYFTPGSYDRQGAGTFLKKRLFRLGNPVLIFMFILGPLTSIAYYLMPSSITGITSPISWSLYPDFIAFGPLWFAVLLLIFSFGYAGWRGLTRHRAAPAKESSRFPGWAGTGLFTLVLAGISYLIRFVIPIGKEILDFPTLSYLPQYLGFFIVGIAASRRNWLSSLKSSTGVAGFGAAALAAVFLFPLAVSGRMFSTALTPLFTQALGGGHWQSLIYALWDSLFAVGICLGLIVLFRRFANRSSSAGQFLSSHSFAVYVVHTTVIVYISYALRGLNLQPWLKFGTAAVISIPAVFAAAYVLKRIPGLSKVL